MADRLQASYDDVKQVRREIGTLHERLFLYDGLAKREATSPLGMTDSRVFSQGGLARSATLGFGAQSLWDWQTGVAAARHRSGSGSWAVSRSEGNRELSMDRKTWVLNSNDLHVLTPHPGPSPR